MMNCHGKKEGDRGWRRWLKMPGVEAILEQEEICLLFYDRIEPTTDRN